MNRVRQIIVAHRGDRRRRLAGVAGLGAASREPRRCCRATSRARTCISRRRYPASSRGIDVARGDRVTAGATLFAMDDASLRAQRIQAAATLAQAQAQIARPRPSWRSRAPPPMRRRRKRPTRAGPGALSQRACASTPQTVSLSAGGYGCSYSGERAGPGGCGAWPMWQSQQAQIEAAKAQMAAQQAALADVAAQLDQLAPHAPAACARAGRVLPEGRVGGRRTSRCQPAAGRQGEAALLRAGEHRWPAIAPAKPCISICDGCAAGLTARINYVSAQPEYTPPIIYSRSTRDKLVFLVEALPSDAQQADAGSAGRRGDRWERHHEAGSAFAIDVHDLNKSFGAHHVVRDVAIQVEEGHICGFLGPNGSGKTTTLRMLCGLLTPDSGSGHLPRLRHPAADRRDQAQHRLHDAALLAVRRSDGRGEPRLHRADVRTGSAARAACGNRSSGLAWRIGATSGRARCPAAGSSGCPLRRAFCTSLGCCCWMNPPRASIRRRGGISGTRSTGWRAKESPCWCPRTTWTRPNAAMTSRISSVAV